MLNPKAFAHAATAVTAVFYIICWTLSSFAPDFVFALGNSWLHSINLESVKATNPISLTTGIIGLLSLSLLTWLTTYVTILLYNKWAK